MYKVLSLDQYYTGSRQNNMRNVLSKFINDTLKLMEKYSLKDNDMRRLNDLIDII